MPAGMLVITRKSGKKLEVYILPGHDEAFYEYGGKDMNGMHRVNREPFLATMKKLGAKVPVQCGRSE